MGQPAGSAQRVNPMGQYLDLDPDEPQNHHLTRIDRLQRPKLSMVEATFAEGYAGEFLPQSRLSKSLLEQAPLRVNRFRRLSVTVLSSDKSWGR